MGEDIKIDVLRKYALLLERRILEVTGEDIDDRFPNPLLVGDAKEVANNLADLVRFLVYKAENNNSGWVSDLSIEFMEAILHPLIQLRDMDMVVRSSDCKNIKGVEYIFDYKESDLTMDILFGYINFKSALDLYYLSKRVFRYGDAHKPLEKLFKKIGVDLKSKKRVKYKKISPDILRKYEPVTTNVWVAHWVLLSEAISRGVKFVNFHT